jgi:hypothetical protein
MQVFFVKRYIVQLLTATYMLHRLLLQTAKTVLAFSCSKFICNIIYCVF